MRLEQLPQREIAPISHFTGAEDALHPKKRGKSEAIGSAAAQLVSQFELVDSDQARVCYILHESRDGELAARALYQKLSFQRRTGKLRHDVKHCEGEALSFVKPAALKARAKKAGMWRAQPFFSRGAVWKSAAFFVSTLLSLLGLGSMLGQIASTLTGTVLLALLTAVSALFALVMLVSKLIANEKKSMALLYRSLQNMDEARLCEFAAHLQAEDFAVAAGDEMSFVLTLKSAERRDWCIYRRYFATLAKKQLWFVFVERRKNNDELLCHPYPNCRLFYYALKPLSLKDKKKLAAACGRNPNSPAIRPYGVDYLCAELLHSPADAEELKRLAARLDRFEQEEKEHFNVYVRSVIGFVADLSVNYAIDFSNPHNWEYLFDYAQATGPLVEADRRLTAEELFHGDVGEHSDCLRHLKKLIALVADAFLDDFHDILANNLVGAGKTGGYVQLCLIKALRCRGEAREERVLAVGETLLREIPERGEWFGDFRTESWKAILSAALGLFERSGLRCFSPAVVHRMLAIWQDVDAAQRPEQLFSLPEVMRAAASNVLLGPGSVALPEEIVGNESDVIRDHYLVLELAAAEKRLSIAPQGDATPPCLELLQLDRRARARYAQLLQALGHGDVLEYYGYLYDLFYAILRDHGEFRFCGVNFYKTDLYAKYGAKAVNNSYIRTILCEITALLTRSLGGSAELADAAGALFAFLEDSDSEENVARLLMAFARSDALGDDTVSFLICLSLRLNRTKELLRETYLALGNYLLRMLFLVYHLGGDFQNDEFQYLLDLLLAHTDPGGSMLACLEFCDHYIMPRRSRERLEGYFARYEERRIGEMIDLAGQIRPSDFESFVAYVTTTSIDEEKQKGIWSALWERLHTQLADAPQIAVWEQMISVRLYGRESELFASRTAQENMQVLQGVSADTLSDLCSAYLQIDKAKYLESFAMIGGRLLNGSKRVRRFFPVTEYLVESTDKSAPAYAGTAKDFVDYILKHVESKSLLFFTVYTANCCARALGAVMEQAKLQPQAFEWLDDERVAKVSKKILEDRDEVLFIESKEIFRERVWKKYGMLLFLKYLLDNCLVSRVTEPADYTDLTDAERIAYIKQHHAEILPWHENECKKSLNLVYVDMVRAFFDNTDEMQRVQDEKETLLRFARDAYSVAQATFARSPEKMVSASRMIDDYIAWAEKS